MTGFASRVVWVSMISMMGMGVASAGFHVSPDGDDNNPGTREKPFATFDRAQTAAREIAGKEPVTVWFADGVYPLSEPIVFTPADAGTEENPVTYVADNNWGATLTGAQPLDLKWEKKGAVWTAPVPKGMDFDQLLVDGRKMVRARFPNCDPKNGFWDRGYRDDNPGMAGTNDVVKRVGEMDDPVGTLIHGYHGLGWGSLHFRVIKKSADGVYTLHSGKDPNLEGGDQNSGRKTEPHAPMGPKAFAENSIELLDAPGEWFLDAKSGVLSFIAPDDIDPNTSRVEGVTLENLVTFEGDVSTPVRFVNLCGFRIAGTKYTFMKTTEAPSGGDWRIYRGGAVYVNGAEDCAIDYCFFDATGGNGVYIHGYNRHVSVTRGKFINSGASCVAIEGEESTLRSRWAHWWGWPEGERGELPVVDGKPFESESFALLPDEMLDGSHPLVDIKPGPANNNYPAECLIEDCLMDGVGAVEKQVSGVFVSKASEITVRHNTISNCSRAAINVNDNCWGGHVFEFNDSFNTSMESREHGCYNSWGRDRYWLKNASTDPVLNERIKRFARLDALKPIVLRNNRLQCAHGYDIDLDDGSANYEIYNNICPQGGIKIREGFFRKVFNNISTTFSPHANGPGNGDVCERNILIGARPYTPKGTSLKTPPDTLDSNLIATPGVKEFKWPNTPAADKNSVYGDAKFVDVRKGFDLADDSPAFALGFKEFDRTKFGVRPPVLKAEAKVWEGYADYDPLDPGEATGTAAIGGHGKPAKPTAKPTKTGGKAGDGYFTFSGLKLRTLVDFGNEAPKVRDMELENNDGVLIVDVVANSAGGRAKVRAQSVILAVNGKPVKSLDEMMTIIRARKAPDPVVLKTLHFDDGAKDYSLSTKKTSFHRVDK